MGMKYKYILWDLDDTLLSYKKSENYALKKAFLKFGHEIDDEAVKIYSSINDGYWKKIERGEIKRQDFVFLRFKELMDKINIQGVDVEMLQPYYQEQLGCSYFYMDNSLELCKKLKVEGYNQYIISNGVKETQYNRLELSGIGAIMDGIFISEEVGYTKPNKEFFTSCYENIQGFDINQCIIIGDSLTSDIKGANNAGIDACWYHEAGVHNDKHPEVFFKYEITNLWQVLDIL